MHAQENFANGGLGLGLDTVPRSSSAEHGSMTSFAFSSTYGGMTISGIPIVRDDVLGDETPFELVSLDETEILNKSPGLMVAPTPMVTIALDSEFQMHSDFSPS